MLKRGQKIGLTEGKALSLLSLFFLGDLAVAPARRCVKTWKEYSWSRVGGVLDDVFVAAERIRFVSF